MAILGVMDDPEVDLWLDVPGAGSNTVTLGEPALFQIFRPMSRGTRRGPMKAKMVKIGIRSVESAMDDFVKTAV